jgi:AraC-like DNA-binding protein
LSEALFVETLRRYMGDLPVSQTGWLAGARDTATGRALALIHREPGRAWAVNTLAREAGLSRSALMERFSHFLDDAPMAYLARWRLQLAARLLETTSRGIVDIAAEVGYESEAAFNRAFRREFGSPPGRYRRAHIGSRS